MRPVLPLLCAGILAVAACGDPNRLPPATFTNFVDTVTIYAVTGTPVWLPSGYAATELRRVRLDQTNTADFAFDLRAGRAVLLPALTVGQAGSGSLNPGLLPTALPFDSITFAETGGYTSEDTVQIAVGRSYYLRARTQPTCFLGSPTYGKLQILSLNDSARTVTFQVLVNANCGYKSLEPGLPTR